MSPTLLQCCRPRRERCRTVLRVVVFVAATTAGKAVTHLHRGFAEIAPSGETTSVFTVGVVPSVKTALSLSNIDIQALQEMAAYYENDIEEISSLLQQDNPLRSPHPEEPSTGSERPAGAADIGVVASRDASGARLSAEAFQAQALPNAVLATVGAVGATPSRFDTGHAVVGGQLETTTLAAERKSDDENVGSIFPRWVLDLDLTLPESIGLAVGFVVSLFILCMIVAKLLALLFGLAPTDPGWNIFIDTAIVVNAVVIALELLAGDGTYLIADNIFNFTYFFEMCVSMTHYGCCGYFRHTWWEWFNFVLVIAGSVEVWILPLVEIGMEGTGLSQNSNVILAVAICRLLRVLRLVRLLRPKESFGANFVIDPDWPAEAFIPMDPPTDQGAAQAATKAGPKTKGKGVAKGMTPKITGSPANAGRKPTGTV